MSLASLGQFSQPGRQQLLQARKRGISKGISKEFLKLPPFKTNCFLVCPPLDFGQFGANPVGEYFG